MISYNTGVQGPGPSGLISATAAGSCFLQARSKQETLNAKIQIYALLREDIPYILIISL